MTNEKDWIDFNLVKEAISMEMLIIHFGFSELSRKGDEVRIKCPFHNGKSSNSMLINLSKNTFYCFGCKARGNVLDFVSEYECCTVRDAAFKLNQWFDVEQEQGINNSNNLPPITPQHLIASIEHQLAQLKRLIFSR